MSFAQASFVCRTACACSLCVYMEDVMSGEDNKEYLPLRQNPWRSVVIDAITVDIKSESVVNVMMPVAAPLLSPHWSWKECENHPESDPALLCQQLSLSAARFFKRSPYCIRLAAQHPGTTFEHFTGMHKKQFLHVAGKKALLQQANSDRPFFALKQITPPIVEGDEPRQTKLWHMYCAMGLPGQHRWQQSLLARCYDFHGAACILRAIEQVLGCKVYSGMVSQTLTGTDADDAGPESLRHKFLTLLSKQGVTVLENTPNPTNAFLALSNSCETRRALEATDLRDCLAFIGTLIQSGSHI